jgi:hypothetical protein
MSAIFDAELTGKKIVNSLNGDDVEGIDAAFKPVTSVADQNAVNSIPNVVDLLADSQSEKDANSVHNDPVVFTVPQLTQVGQD